MLEQALDSMHRVDKKNHLIGPLLEFCACLGSLIRWSVTRLQSWWKCIEHSNNPRNKIRFEKGIERQKKMQGQPQEPGIACFVVVGGLGWLRFEPPGLI